MKTAEATNFEHQAVSKMQSRCILHYYLLPFNVENRLHGNCLFLAEPR